MTTTNKPICNAGLANCLELYQGITDTDLVHLNFGEAAPRFAEHTVPARRTIFHRGETIEGIPIICSGWAVTVSTLPNSRRQIISVLLPGDLVSGALVFSDKLDFTVEAITNVIYHCYDRTEFCAAMSANPSLNQTILKAWNEEYLRIVQSVISLGQCTAEERVSRLLLNLFERLALRGLVTDRTFNFPMRQTHIAEMTGLTPVHISRVFNNLRQQGLIDLADRTVTVRDPVALRRQANAA